MASIPKEMKLPGLILDFDSDSTGEAAALGLKWHTVKDVFSAK